MKRVSTGTDPTLPGERGERGIVGRQRHVRVSVLAEKMRIT
ncbi:hypothetical protein [Micropruina sp.]